MRQLNQNILAPLARRRRRCPLLAVVLVLMVLAPVTPGFINTLAAAPTTTLPAEIAPGSHPARTSSADYQPTLSAVAVAQAQDDVGGISLPQTLPELTSRQNLGPALQMIVLLTVLSLAPGILVLCTSFTRIIIVLSLLRQAIGTQNLPPNQVLAGLSLFMTCVVMAPTWRQINDSALQPYVNGQISQQEALASGVVPLREFMIAQIEAAENSETVLVFLEHSRQPTTQDPTWGDIPTATLIPAFVLSELKVAFLMGFKIYLPFLVIDLIVSAVLASMGMLMLPPVLVSLPFKLLLFVLVDGWTLVAAGLMGSFVIASG